MVLPRHKNFRPNSLMTLSIKNQLLSFNPGLYKFCALLIKMVSISVVRSYVKHYPPNVEADVITFVIQWMGVFYDLRNLSSSNTHDLLDASFLSIMIKNQFMNHGFWLWTIIRLLKALFWSCMSTKYPCIKSKETVLT